MPDCPRCGNPINGEFGIISCPKCNTVLIANLDGKLECFSEEDAKKPALPVYELDAKHGEETAADDGFSPETYVLPDADLPSVLGSETDDEEPSQPEPNIGFYREDTPSVAEDLAAHSLVPEDNFQEQEIGLPNVDTDSVPDLGPEIPTSDSPESGKGDFAWDASAGYSDNAKIETAAEPSAIFSDIAAFANSEISAAHDGVLYFDINIEGIDSAEMRGDLAEILSDARFAWDTQELLRSITSGSLKISRINSVKASILVNRIKQLPLDISWEQHALTES